ncbi:MAG TPA: hypothetical protein VF655_08285 [Allosphingosinicella sp.]|jgi:hypothetical protein
MSRQNAPFAFGTADAGGEIAQLRQVLALVEELAGATLTPDAAALDEAARVSAAYEAAAPIVQRRFDQEAAHTARWAAAGLEALVTLEERGWPVKPAAGRLAEELRKALGTLREIVAA